MTTEPTASNAERDFLAAKAAWLAEPGWSTAVQAYERGWFDCAALATKPPAGEQIDKESANYKAGYSDGYQHGSRKGKR